MNATPIARIAIAPIGIDGAEYPSQLASCRTPKGRGRNETSSSPCSRAPAMPSEITQITRWRQRRNHATCNHEHRTEHREPDAGADGVHLARERVEPPGAERGDGVGDPRVEPVERGGVGAEPQASRDGDGHQEDQPHPARGTDLLGQRWRSTARPTTSMSDDPRIGRRGHHLVGLIHASLREDPRTIARVWHPCPTLLAMRVCPRCGEENPERARFCLNCGEPMAEAEDRRRERKFATALFADLVGSTSLAEREDPEVVQAVVGRAFDRLAEEVDRYEGLLEKFMGDAILAVFGVPRAHEDDPERAVRAAIEMQAVLSELNHGFAAEGKPRARDADRRGGRRGARRPRARQRTARSHADRRRGQHRRPAADGRGDRAASSWARASTQPRRT